MKFCSHCGAQVEDDAVICIKMRVFSVIQSGGSAGQAQHRFSDFELFFPADRIDSVSGLEEYLSTQSQKLRKGRTHRFYRRCGDFCCLFGDRRCFAGIHDWRTCKRGTHTVKSQSKKIRAILKKVARILLTDGKFWCIIIG